MRDWSQEDIKRLRGPYKIEYTVADLMSKKLRQSLQVNYGTRALGASTPAQAVQMVQAGLSSIYLSGWQVAADVNGDMYPDQSLYPCDRVPKLIKAINNALLRQSQISSANGEPVPPNGWLVPIVADCEAGFGGVLNAYELTRKMIEAGAAAVHFEDQLSSEKKCGHLGGKVLVPVQEFVNKLKAARLAADVCGVETVIIARTDANSAKLLTSDIDSRDAPFIGDPALSDGLYKPRTPEGFFIYKGGIDAAIARGLAYAPYADLLWCETSTPCLEEAQKFADAIRKEFPGKMLAYNCSPSFNWSAHLKPNEIREFQDKLVEMGYRFQFITLAGFHSLNLAMFELSSDYKDRGMAAYSEIQDLEFSHSHTADYRAVKHQGFVGTGYFDSVRNAITGGGRTSAMSESTEAEQF
jgi:isocitrate lyase